MLLPASMQPSRHLIIFLNYRTEYIQKYFGRPEYL